MAANDVTLTVGGMDYAGWKAVDITAGIERQARDFSLSVSWRWPGQAVDIPIKWGDRVELRIGHDLVLTGYVDATPVSYDGTSITRGVAGRSLTADLVDCSAINSPGQWLGQRVQAIVAALAGQYGVAVRSEASASAALADHTIEPGESVFESIDRLLTQSRLLSCDDAAGRVVIARPGSAGRAADRIELGRNVLRSESGADFGQVFSEYRVIGQHAGTDDDFGAEANEIEAEAKDERCPRKRVLVLQQSGQLTQAMARDRANWERASRVGRALAATYTVQGWRQSDGRLWLPNSIAHVVDPVRGFDRELLISEVNYKLDEGGELVRLTVAPQDAFEPEPATPKKGKGGGDAFEYLLPEDWEDRT